jgi:hypothetical protein
MVMPPRQHYDRPYPAPTGLPAFRRYYQIRYYPGCHTYGSATPVPTRIHP